MMRPQLRLSMPGMQARANRTPDITLTSTKRIQSSTGISKNPLGSKMPALLMRMSTSGSAATSALQPAAVETSAATPRTLALGTTFVIAATAASTLAWVRPLTTTVVPAEASPLAMAWPMPEVEPVTSAVFPVRSIFMTYLHE
jgi:hypothetical protein